LLVPLAIAGDASKIGTGANSDTSTSKDWEFNLAPFYLWAVCMEGEQTIGSNTGDIDVDLDDVFDKLEAPLFSIFRVCGAIIGAS
jgi:hypothetical protein